MARGKSFGVSISQAAFDKLVRMADSSGMRTSAVIEKLIDAADESKFVTPIVVEAESKP